MNTVHTGIQQFSCDRCDYKTNDEAELSKHITSRHLQSSTRRYNCDKCSRSYTWLRDLSRHKRLKHASVIPHFICDYCGFETDQKSCLLTHVTGRHRKYFSN